MALVMKNMHVGLESILKKKYCIFISVGRNSCFNEIFIMICDLAYTRPLPYILENLTKSISFTLV
jgi:hypothetical protein